MNHKEFFNSMAEKWDTICHYDKNKNNEMLDLVNIKQGSKVLDVGTGTGVMIPFLTSRIGDTGEIVAVDVVEKMIEVARANTMIPTVTPQQNRCYPAFAARFWNRVYYSGV